MSDALNLADKINNLVCDAVPDPPRINENTLDNQNLSQAQKSSKKDSNIPLNKGNRSSTSSNTKNETTNTEDIKFPKSKKNSKPSNYIINSHHLKFGPKYVITLNNYQGNNCTPENKCDYKKPKQMPPHIQSFVHCQEEITSNDILLVKTHIGKGWREFAERLGYTEGQMDQFYDSYKHKGFGEVVYHILVDWKQSRTKDAKIGDLVYAMWISQQYDCAQKLAEAHNVI